MGAFFVGFFFFVEGLENLFPGFPNEEALKVPDRLKLPVKEAINQR